MTPEDWTGLTDAQVKEKLAEALEPFVVAFAIAVDSLPQPADIGHTKAIADLYVKSHEYRRARIALASYRASLATGGEDA